MKKLLLIVGGMLAAIATGVLLLGTLMGVAVGLTKLMPDNWTPLLVGYPSIFVLPMVMGIVAAYFWVKAGVSPSGYLFYSVVLFAASMAGAYFFLKEGVVCLVMAAPLVLIGMIAGACIGRTVFRAWPGNLNLTVFPAVLLLVAGEYATRMDERACVTDEVVIRASPAQVWPHVTAFPPIAEAPDFWLFKVGLPSPSETTTAGNYVGAERKCIFGNGVVFDERVAEIVPNELLTFDIVEQPRDPELLGHLTLHRGQFILRDNGDGTTTLTGRSWYTLHVRPLWYFDVWTRAVTREVHLRVMRHIKQLAEVPS